MGKSLGNLGEILGKSSLFTVDNDGNDGDNDDDNDNDNDNVMPVCQLVVYICSYQGPVCQCTREYL